MKRHDWAVARLWEALVSNDDARWRKGAEVLSDAPLLPEQVASMHDPSLQAMGDLAGTVQDLAKQALDGKGVSRASIVAGVFATCASCHKLAEKK